MDRKYNARKKQKFKEAKAARKLAKQKQAEEERAQEASQQRVAGVNTDTMDGAVWAQYVFIYFLHFCCF